MIKSSSGELPVTGIETLIRPENPTGSTALISSSGSVEINDQAVSSITNVKVPAVSFRLAMVKDTGVGVGV